MLNEYLGKLIPVSMNLGKSSFYPVEGSSAHSTVLSNPYIRAEQISLRKLKKFYASSSLITVVPATPTPPMPGPFHAESRSVCGKASYTLHSTYRSIEKFNQNLNLWSL